MRPVRFTATVAATLSASYLALMAPWTQFFGAFIWRASTEEKLVALTFDDGPSEPFTTKILDILDAHGAVGTFFVVGHNVDRSPEVVKQIAHAGHELGNHSLRHQIRRSFVGRQEMRSDIETTQQLIERASGVRPTLFRPPWLFRTPRILQTVGTAGLRTIGGEFGHVLEVFQPNPTRMAKSTLRKIRPGSIIIFHDGCNARQGVDRIETVCAVDLVASSLAASGWQMVGVSELLRRSCADRHPAPTSPISHHETGAKERRPSILHSIDR
ncbi:MAG: polysaccharide deacetylase family protein [Ilumatobacteraceae bacterium]|nr:polysaccharide deacetylase family protein [Ilumatobacteraceae bacterium]